MDQQTADAPMRVRVTDIDISFGQMFILTLKFAIAAIPAALVFGVLVGVVAIMMAAGAR